VDLSNGIRRDDGCEPCLGTAAGLPAHPIEIIRSTSTSTAAFNHEANPLEAGEHRRPEEPSSNMGADLVSPSTAMPTAASWWTRKNAVTPSAVAAVSRAAREIPEAELQPGTSS
jgi:hypothetical protein